MSHYVDGFVIPIPKNRVEDYRRIAEQACKIWKEYGALDYWECLGDDLEQTETDSFLRLAGAGPDETVIFSWVVFRSRADRDEANAKIMADPRVKAMCDPDNAPFDPKRMVYGGFSELVRG